jgi:hypothetical protein
VFDDRLQPIADRRDDVGRLVAVKRDDRDVLFRCRVPGRVSAEDVLGGDVVGDDRFAGPRNAVEGEQPGIGREVRVPDLPLCAP